jgi:DNA-binding response OmpR family regulator
VPVIMLSSKDGLFDKARGRMVGSQDYLTKPFTKDQLLQQPCSSSAPLPTPDAADRSRMMPIQKILVVDDSKTELHHLSDLLGKRGYSVRTAENGEEACAASARKSPTSS